MQYIFIETLDKRILVFSDLILVANIDTGTEVPHGKISAVVLAKRVGIRRDLAVFNNFDVRNFTP